MKVILGGSSGISFANIGSAPVSLLDPDAQSFINAAMITNPTQISAINNFVINSKNFEIWSKLRAIYPFVGGTAFSHKWNLKDPRDLDEAYRLVFFGGVTHNFEGVQGNGVNGYANTFLSHNSTRNTGGISSYILNNIAEQSTTIRVEISGSLITQILPRWTDNFAYFRAYSSSSISIPNTDSKGFFGISRINNNTVVVNLKGSTTTHNNVAAGMVGTDRSYYIMAANFQNTVSRPGTHKIAFTTIHDGMNAVDLENLRIAIQIFQTELGRSL